MEEIKKKQTITLTLGEVSVTHIGMPENGKRAEEGFTIEEIRAVGEKAVQDGFPAELYLLNSALPPEYINSSEPAAIIVIRGGVNWLLQGSGYTADDMLSEQLTLSPDTKYYDWKKKKVFNNQARLKLCFANFDQVADFENGKGTIVDINRLPVLNYARNSLHRKIGEKAASLNAEGNYYTDVKTNFIGAHGDRERKKVIALRLGAQFPLYYQWFLRSRPASEMIPLSLNHGDLYIMSEKAAGSDWLSKKFLTLRHSAGELKYVMWKEKKKKE